MKSLMTIFLLTISIVAAGADPSTLSIAEYKERKNNKQTWPATRIYLNGVGTGLSLSAAFLLQQKRPPLFCQPEGVVLKPENYIALIDALMAKNKLPDVPVESVLLMALMTAFPCD
jgi:hypothetical protein